MNNRVNLESLTIPNWKTYLVITLLILAVLVQVVVLRWSLEAVFFATWFLLMLVGPKQDRLDSLAISLEPRSDSSCGASRATMP